MIAVFGLHGTRRVPGQQFRGWADRVLTSFPRSEKASLKAVIHFNRGGHRHNDTRRRDISVHTCKLLELNASNLGLSKFGTFGKLNGLKIGLSGKYKVGVIKHGSYSPK